MWKVRQDEPEYAFLPEHRTNENQVPEKNRYGKSIQLVEESDELAGKSLNINADDTVGENPDRYKQHGFYFNADNCISCHACESACSEKNDLAPHLAFRSVGYVEGGTYPAYQRLNISMACNHCDDPVCLKGCPTRAYTKFAEYGAVLQDPDICFGCGYCTWVCPYNAPQLDPVNGQVEKCNMCVDRLEAGLKPACASACLAGALDFGVIETTPENRTQLNTSIPGFPDPEITHPNIRFQQTRSLPAEMHRTDSAPIRYERDDDGVYHSRVDKREAGNREWNLGKLSSRENPLVVFTLLSQLAIGAFGILFLLPLAGYTDFSLQQWPRALPLTQTFLMGLLGLGLFMSTIHLGKPMRFYRGFNNWRYSPVSREAASLMVFFGLAGLYTLLSFLPWFFDVSPASLQGTLNTLGVLACGFGLLTLYFMHRIYRIKARPFWNHWQVLTSFYGTMLSLGGIFSGLVLAVLYSAQGDSVTTVNLVCGSMVLAGYVLESFGLWFHARDMKRQDGEGGAAYHVQATRFGKTWILRNTGLFAGIMLASGLLMSGTTSIISVILWVLLASVGLVTAVIGRALFYVLVIPTTMPGAFFWRNAGFQEHARETGLADMPQTGVIPDAH